MSRAAPLSMFMRVRRMLDRLAVYLPLLLMGLMAMSTYWLVRNTPSMGEAEQDAPLRHVPDYFMRDLSVKVFAEDGRLKSEMVGVEGRHYPDTETLEVDQPRLTSAVVWKSRCGSRSQYQCARCGDPAQRIAQ